MLAIRPDDHVACRIHRKDVVASAEAVADPDIPFVAITHRELWMSWQTAADSTPDWLPEHARRLEERYRVSIVIDDDRSA